MVAERDAAWRIIASMEQKKETIEVEMLDGICAAQAPTHQIAVVTDAIEDKDQLSKTDARVECIVEKIIDDHVLRVTDNAVEGVKCSAQERVQSYTVEQSVDVPVTRRCAFTMEDSDELIPEWLSFVKGVVDSEDPPLNIYRETLPENKILRVIKKHVTKCLEMLAEIAELSDAYKEFYEQLVKCMKLGIDEDSTIGVKTAEVLRFNTSKSGDERINSKEYADRIKEGQNDVYHIAGENTAVVSSFPFEENLRKKGHEEFHVADPMDEYAAYQFKESDGTKLNPTTKEGLNLGDQDDKKKHEELKTEFEPQTKLMKHILVDKVERAMVSDRIVDSPCVLTTSEYGWSAKIERIMEAQALRDNSMTSHMVSKKTTEVNPTHSIMMELKSRHDLHGHLQQQHKSSKHQPTKQSTRQERGGERKRERNREGKRGRSEQEEERDQEGRKEEERKVEERGSEQVKKDVTDWIVVARKKNKRKMVQIFVKVDGSRVSPMEVSLTDDKVEDVLRQVQNDEDVYVTMHGRVLKKSERLKSCGVTDGCTIQVTSRLRGGGKHKNKRSMTKTKRNEDESGKKDQQVGSMSDKCQEMTQAQKDVLIQTIEENEGYRRLITAISEAENWEYEMQCFRKQLLEKSGIEEERAKVMEWGMRWAVEARRRRRDEEQGQSPEQEQGRKVRFEKEEEPLEETRAESTDEQKATDGLAEVRTGRGSTGLVRGRDERSWADETRKDKGKGNGGKGEHGRKGGEGNKGAMHVENSVMDEDQEAEEEERGRVAPNMGAGSSHPQATTNPGEEKKEIRVLSWADCNDEEVEENEEEEMTDERPPGLEEEEPKMQQEEKPSQVESEQEAQEEERRRAQEAPEQRRAQEAREEERRSHEAREQKRAQKAREEEQRTAREAREEEGKVEEARELRRAQEAREEERRAQEAHEEQRRAQKALEQRRAQEEQEREAKAQQEQEREAKKAQEEREKDVKAQEERERRAKEAKAHEEQEWQVRENRGSGGAKRATERS